MDNVLDDQGCCSGYPTLIIEPFSVVIAAGSIHGDRIVTDGTI
jgi:hypothetical protein